MPSAIRAQRCLTVCRQTRDPDGNIDCVDLLVNYGSSDVHNTRFYLNKEDSDYQTSPLSRRYWVKLILEREVTTRTITGTHHEALLSPRQEHDVPEGSNPHTDPETGLAK